MVQNEEKCVLCSALQLQTIDTINGKLLKDIYQKNFKIAVEGPTNDLKLLRCPSCDLRFYTGYTEAGSTFYDQLQKNDWYYLEDKAEYAFARQSLTTEDAVLEIGAGSGRFSFNLPCRSYVGLEFSQQAIVTGKERGVNLQRESIEEHALIYADHYDAVCTFQVLEHIADPQAFISASLTCLKSGGLFIVSVPSEDSYLAYEVNNVLNMPPHHVSRWSDACLKNLEQVFPIECTDLWHEKLTDTGVESCARSMAGISLRNMFGWKYQVLDERFARFPWRKAVKVFGRIIEKSLRDEVLRPVGHSVVAIYRKK